MPVGLDESGDGDVTVQVKDLGGLTDVGGDLVVAANGDEATGAHRQGLRSRTAVVNGMDRAAAQDEVGGHFACGWRGQRHQAEADGPKPAPCRFVDDGDNTALGDHAGHRFSDRREYL